MAKRKALDLVHTQGAAPGASNSLRMRIEDMVTIDAITEMKDSFLLNTNQQMP